MQRSKRYEIDWVNGVSRYKHTRLSKVPVSGFVSRINMGLVKDRMSYALHNGRGLIIMQIRSKAGIRKRVNEGRRRGKPRETLLNPETAEVTTRH